MSIGLLITDRNLDELVKGIKEKLPELNVAVWPDIKGLAEAKFIVAWRQPHNIWQQLPNVEVICSLGAGVDGLINDAYLPKKSTLIRIVDDSLSEQMARFVLSVILMKNNRLDCYFNQQKAATWRPLNRYEYQNVTVLGVGQIGRKVGQQLHRIGFNVIGWNRKSKPQVDFEVKTGINALPEVLANADYVVSLLPSTQDTVGIIDAEKLQHMPAHACFINVGRGSTVNEDDLLNALNNKVITSAVLDVVQHEPLPASHPFWTHPAITLTPHIAAITDQKQVVRQIIDNYLAYINKKPLNNVVDRKRGY